MKIRRRILNEDGTDMIHFFDSPDNDFDLELLPKEDQVRVGFEKGTLTKAVFELSNGQKIIYEKVEEPKPVMKYVIPREIPVDKIVDDKTISTLLLNRSCAQELKETRLLLYLVLDKCGPVAILNKDIANPPDMSMFMQVGREFYNNETVFAVERVKPKEPTNESPDTE